MTKRIQGLFVGMAALAGVAAIAPAAWAGCGSEVAKQPAAWEGTAADQLFTPADFGRPDFGRPPITGLWSVTLTSQSGQNDDWGFSEWHSDGTEIMNSGGHAPSTGNFCLGVWAQTGANSYHLNHWALGYAPSTSPPFGTLAVKVNLREDVSLGAGGATFKGTFAEDIFVQGGPTLHDRGTITGQRVTPF